MPLIAWSTVRWERKHSDGRLRSPCLRNAGDRLRAGWDTGSIAIANSGQLIEPENINQLAQAMARQAAQTKLTIAEALAVHARVAETFSMEKSAAEVLRLYQRLVGLIS